MNDEIQPRTVIVTGAVSGIGRGIAERFAHDGISVVCADINEVEVKKVAAELKDSGHAAMGVAVDVTSEVSVIEIVNRTVDWTGRNLHAAV